MKRRAQGNVAPAATKKKQTKPLDEDAEAEAHMISTIPAPRTSKTNRSSSSSSSSSHVIIIDDQSSSSSSTVSQHSHDLSSGHPSSDTSPLPASPRYSHASAPRNSSSHVPSSSSTNSTATKHTLSSPHPSLSTQVPSNSVPTLAVLSSIAQSPSFNICWARVNRSPWWPGKILYGDDIPEDLRDKKKSAGFQCVELYNRDERGWVNRDRIVPFALHPEGPEERKRPPQPPLAKAIELASYDLSNLRRQSRPASTPIATTSTSVQTSKKVASPPVAFSPNTASTSTPYLFVQSGVTNTIPKSTASVRPTNATAAQSRSTVSVATSAPRTALKPQHEGYIHHVGLDPKLSALGYGQMEPDTATGVVVRKDLHPGKPLPASFNTYVTTNPKTTSPVATKSTAAISAKATTPKVPLLQPLPVHHSTSTMTNGHQPSSAVIAISRPATTSAKPSGAKAVGRPRKDNSTKDTISALHTNSSTPSSLNHAHMDTTSEATSVHSSRAPSPVRSGTSHTAKIGEHLKPVEEYNSYRGTASVGHVVANKPNALMSGSRASSQVDALTVVSCLKYRGVDGQIISTPITEKHYIGMQNLGNTCYINSAIQCLAHVASFCSPLTSMDVTLDDVLRNAVGLPPPSNGSLNDGENGSSARRMRSRTSGPPMLQKRNRSRRSMIPALHNPEEAKSNPLIASLVALLKTLTHPEYLIQHSDKNPNHLYMGKLTPSGQARLAALLKATGGIDVANGIDHSSDHSLHQQLLANSSDEDMDVDPINVDDDDTSNTDEDDEEEELVPPKDVTKALHAFQNSSGQLLDEKYYTDQHQDISEFILHLLEYTHDQLNTKKPFPMLPAPATPSKSKRGSKVAVTSSSSSVAPPESPRSIAHAADYANLPKLEMDCKEWYHYMATNQSPVTNSFDGLLRRKRKCPKDHTFVSYEIFRILTLHFEDENAKECTLEDMFATLRKPEFLDCRCSLCGGTDNKAFSQVTDVYILPKYLIITLGRFKGSTSEQSWWAHKIKTRVKFPLDKLDLAPLFDIAPGQPSPIYNLVAISNHKGSSIQGGHYFSYVRSWPNSDHWVNLNDTTIKELRTDSIVTNQAYMLFYERQDH